MPDVPLDVNDLGGLDQDRVLRVELDLPAEPLAAYEWVDEERRYREWLIPASIVNAAGTVMLHEEGDLYVEPPSEVGDSAPPRLGFSSHLWEHVGVAAAKRYEVTASRKILKGLTSYPKSVQKAFHLLVEDLESAGPLQPLWPNYSSLGKNRYHCHLAYGWVACRKLGTDKITIEVYYAGSREKAPH